MKLPDYILKQQQFPPIKVKTHSFAVLKSLFYGGILLILIIISQTVKTSAASYDATTPPPACVSQVGLEYSLEYYLDDAVEDWSAGDTRFDAVQAFKNGAPTIAYSFAQPTTGDDIHTFHIKIFNYDGTSSSSTGVGMPGTLDEFIRYIGTGGSVDFRFLVGEDGGIGTHPSFPGPQVISWSTILASDANGSLPQGTAFNLNDTSPLDCIWGVQNVYFTDPINTTYAQLSDYEADQESPETGFWSSVTGALSTIVEFIQDLPDLLLSLVVPESTTITAITDDFTDFFETKLGFLLWPFEFVDDLLSTIMGTGLGDEYDEYGNPFNNCASYSIGSDISYWSFGTLWGGAVRIHPCVVQNSLPGLWTFATIAARAVLVLAVVNFLLRAHRRHIK